MADQDLFTASQAAEALSASSQTIRNWIRGDRLHAVRIGNRFLIPRSEIERMRGDLSAAAGESSWASDPDEPAHPPGVRRAGVPMKSCWAADGRFRAGVPGGSSGLA